MCMQTISLKCITNGQIRNGNACLVRLAEMHAGTEVLTLAAISESIVATATK